MEVSKFRIPAGRCPGGGFRENPGRSSATCRLHLRPGTDQAKPAAIPGVEPPSKTYPRVIHAAAHAADSAGVVCCHMVIVVRGQVGHTTGRGAGRSYTGNLARPFGPSR